MYFAQEMTGLYKLIFYHVNRPVGAWNRRNYQL